VAINNKRYRKKDSARLVWDSKPRRAAKPKDVELQTAEVVIPNPQHPLKLPSYILQNKIPNILLPKTLDTAENAPYIITVKP